MLENVVEARLAIIPELGEPEKGLSLHDQAQVKAAAGQVGDCNWNWGKKNLMSYYSGSHTDFSAAALLLTSAHLRSP